VILVSRQRGHQARDRELSSHCWLFAGSDKIECMQYILRMVGIWRNALRDPRPNCVLLWGCTTTKRRFCEERHFRESTDQPSWKCLFSGRWGKTPHKNIFPWSYHINHHENVYFHVGFPSTLMKIMYILWRYCITLMKMIFMIGEPFSWKGII